MATSLQHQLSRRERQIMDAIYRLGRATAAEVRDNIPDAPSYSAVRAHLRILEEKGHLTHEQEGPRYVYRPTVPGREVRQTALSHVVRTFFDGSVAQAVAALLGDASVDLSDDEYARLMTLIEDARSEGR